MMLSAEIERDEIHPIVRVSLYEGGGSHQIGEKLARRYLAALQEMVAVQKLLIAVTGETEKDIEDDLWQRDDCIWEVQ